jgi:hypothetical protein
MTESPNGPATVHPASRSSPATPVADIRRGILAWDGPWVGASLSAMCLLGVSSVALASPGGVAEYRLAFVTDADIAGSSADIATYNQFAATQAALNTSLPTTTWKAIVSTATMSAANNISCGAACNANVPIFLIGGTEVATSTINLFRGSAGIMNVIAEDENGASASGAYVWTGSNSDGTAATGHVMGESAPVFGWNEIGFPGFMFGYGETGESDTLPVYAISGALSAVPEPTSLSLLAFSGAAIGLMRKFRRRRRATR